MVETLEEIEAKALLLPERSRAELAKSLLSSLDTESLEAEDEIAHAWIVEAERRAAEIENGQTEAIPHEDVRREVHARLR